jgi:hypothetical protein
MAHDEYNEHGKAKEQKDSSSCWLRPDHECSADAPPHPNGQPDTQPQKEAFSLTLEDKPRIR